MRNIIPWFYQTENATRTFLLLSLSHINIFIDKVPDNVSEIPSKKIGIIIPSHTSSQSEARTCRRPLVRQVSSESQPVDRSVFEASSRIGRIVVWPVQWSYQSAPSRPRCTKYTIRYTWASLHGSKEYFYAVAIIRFLVMGSMFFNNRYVRILGTRSPKPMVVIVTKQK